jgi:hypothetical protein
VACIRRYSDVDRVSFDLSGADDWRAPWGRVMRIVSSITERPSCPTCKHRMGLAGISVAKPGFEQRTFECATCHRIEKISIPIDPLKTDAIGWMASELEPPD